MESFGRSPEIYIPSLFMSYYIILDSILALNFLTAIWSVNLLELQRL